MADTQTLEQRMEALEKGYQALAKENEALKTQLQNKEAKKQEKPKPVIPNKTFKVDGQEFRFTAATLRVKKKDGWVEMTATDALNDKDVLAHLVATNSSLIAAVEK